MAVRTFDLGEYTRTAHGSHREAIGEVGALPDDERDLVSLLADLESGTMPYLRRVLVTPTHKDARVTAFLVTWSFERFWTADALRVLLERSDASRGPGSAVRSVADRPSGASAHGARRARRGPVVRAVGTLFSGPELVAAHVASLAASEAVTRAAYARLAATTPSTAAAELYRRLDAVHERQEAFLLDEARVRLEGSARGIRLARRELADERRPLGLADRPPADAARFARLVFPGGEPEASDALASIAALPGLGPAAARAAAALAP